MASSDSAIGRLLPDTGPSTSKKRSPHSASRSWLVFSPRLPPSNSAVPGPWPDVFFCTQVHRHQEKCLLCITMRASPHFDLDLHSPRPQLPFLGESAQRPPAVKRQLGVRRFGCKVDPMRAPRLLSALAHHGMDDASVLRNYPRNSKQEMHFFKSKKAPLRTRRGACKSTRTQITLWRMQHTTLVVRWVRQSLLGLHRRLLWVFLPPVALKPLARSGFLTHTHQYSKFAGTFAVSWQRIASHLRDELFYLFFFKKKNSTAVVSPGCQINCVGCPTVPNIHVKVSISDHPLYSPSPGWRSIVHGPSAATQHRV